MQDIIELHIQDLTRSGLNLCDTKFNELHTAQIIDWVSLSVSTT
jgi:hypothetical protein